MQASRQARECRYGRQGTENEGGIKVACRCHGKGCETAGVALPLPKVESPNGEGHLKVMQANEPVQANRESPSGERCLGENRIGWSCNGGASRWLA